MISKVIVYSIISIITIGISRAQLPDTIELKMILDLAIEDNISARGAEADRMIAEHNIGIFEAGLLPQLTLSGTLPNFTRSSNPVIQSDGTISFQSIRYDNSSVRLNVNQVISKTGTEISLQSNFQIFRDSGSDRTQFNAIPLRLGISQSIFGYNPFKWDKKIQPLVYKESLRQFSADIEALRALTIASYFDVLLSSKILESARFNSENARDLLRIAEERFSLGRLSRNDLLQLQLAERNANNIVSQSERLLTSATAALYDILGIRYNGKVSVPQVPEALDVNIDQDAALEYSRLNRPEILSFNRVLLERQSDLDFARKENGFQMDVFAAFGLNRSAMEVSNLFSDLQQDQVFTVGISLPILDWGSRKNKIAIARTNLHFDEERVRIEKTQIESNLIKDLINFGRLKEELVSMEEITMIARDRFEIARESFVLGSVSVTELSISQQEQDTAIRSYINTLSTYWNTYYQIRSQTLYDFQQMHSLVN